MLRIHRIQAPVTVLGPSSRAVIWVQGCNIGCEGCLAPHTQDTNAGVEMVTGQVSRWILRQKNIEGITISGGEPTLQSRGIVDVINAIREHADMGVVCYTGRTIESMLAEGDEDIQALLQSIDLLIDGPYVKELHASLLWRGSSNQRLIPLTNRYREIIENLTAESDRSAGIEFTVSHNALLYAGVPAEMDFNDALLCQMNTAFLRASSKLE